MDENIRKLLEERDNLVKNQRELYIASITNLNHRYRELLKNDFASQLVGNCAKDAADEVVRRYFDTADYYLTPSQLFERIVHFSYDSEPDPLSQYNEQIRKNMLNMNDSKQFSQALKSFEKTCQEASTKLFEKEPYIDKNGKMKSKYIDSELMTKGKEKYRNSRHEIEGDVIHDELSGVSSEEARLEVDHVQSTSKASYNSRYLRDPEAIKALKEFYNSSDNFQMLEKRANGSKGDVEVYEYNGKTYSEVEYIKERDTRISKRADELEKTGMGRTEAKKQAKTEITEEMERNKIDITYRASAKQVADAVCDRWENTKGETKEELIKTGKLDKNGKVPPEVRKKLEDDLRHSMNKESRVILQHFDKMKVASDAFEECKKGLTKIVIGQVIYYVLPPVVFETKSIVRKKGMTLDAFFKEIKASGKRIVKYVSAKLGNILKGIVDNSFKKFIKSFFDIIIEMVKETAKRMMKIAKELVLSIVQCVKIIGQKESSPNEKADAITKILSSTVTVVVLEVLFEYLEKKYALPDILMEPLQVIVTIIATNLIMLVLQKADLFDVQYGLLIANIDKAFQDEYNKFTSESIALMSNMSSKTNMFFEKLDNEIQTIKENIVHLDFYYDDASEELNKLNQIYNMGINYAYEWKQFVAG